MKIARTAYRSHRYKASVWIAKGQKENMRHDQQRCSLYNQFHDLNNHFFYTLHSYSSLVYTYGSPTSTQQEYLQLLVFWGRANWSIIMSYKYIAHYLLTACLICIHIDYPYRIPAKTSSKHLHVAAPKARSTGSHWEVSIYPQNPWTDNIYPALVASLPWSVCCLGKPWLMCPRRPPF